MNLKEQRRTTGTNARRKLKRRKKRVILCCSHEFGVQLVTAFAYDSRLQELFEVVHVFTDNASRKPGNRPVWEYDSQFPEERLLVAQKVSECKSAELFSRDLEVTNRQYRDGLMHDAINRHKADCLVSATYHGIFGESVLERILGFNFHPSAYLKDLESSIPKRYRGKFAGRHVIEDISSGASPGAVVGLHELTPAVDAGTVFAWSDICPVTIPKIPSVISEERQRQLWARRMNIFQKTVGARVFTLATKALPYLLDACPQQPEGVLSRDKLVFDAVA